jgi:hypothetical protein
MWCAFMLFVLFAWIALAMVLQRVMTKRAEGKGSKSGAVEDASAEAEAPVEDAAAEPVTDDDPPSDPPVDVPVEVPPAVEVPDEAAVETPVAVDAAVETPVADEDPPAPFATLADDPPATQDVVVEDAHAGETVIEPPLTKETRKRLVDRLPFRKKKTPAPDDAETEPGAVPVVEAYAGVVVVPGVPTTTPDPAPIVVAPASTAVSMPPPDARLAPATLDIAGLAVLDEADPDFDPKAFFGLVTDMFFSVHIAITARDVEPVRGFMDERTVRVQRMRAETSVTHRTIERFDGLQVEDIRVLSVDHKQGHDVVRLIVAATAELSTIDELTGKVIEDPGGRKNGKTAKRFEEGWTLIRDAAEAGGNWIVYRIDRD